MKSLSTRLNTITYSITFLFFLFASFSFSQDSSVEDRFEIDELNLKMKKNNAKIEKLEKSLNILNNIEANVLSNSTANTEQLAKSLEQIKSANPNDISKIENALDEINFQITKGGMDFHKLLGRYEQASEGNIEIFLFLSEISSKLKNHYKYPDFIEYDYDYDGEGKTVIDEGEFEAYKATHTVKELTESHLKIIQSITQPIGVKKQEVTDKIQSLEKENKESRQEIVKLQVEIEEKSSYDKTVIKLGFPIFIFFILAIYLVPLYFVYKRENLDGQRTENLYRMIYGSGLVTEIITVFLLTSTILLLGITDKLAPEILGTLIGGISGYVLGRSFNNSENMKQNAGSNNNSTENP